MINVKTVKAGHEYRATATDGVGVEYKFQFIRSEQHVWVYTPHANLGGWKLERFEGGVLSPASIKAFLADPAALVKG